MQFPRVDADHQLADGQARFLPFLLRGTQVGEGEFGRTCPTTRTVTAVMADVQGGLQAVLPLLWRNSSRAG